MFPSHLSLGAKQGAGKYFALDEGLFGAVLNVRRLSTIRFTRILGTLFERSGDESLAVLIHWNNMQVRTQYYSPSGSLRLSSVKAVNI